MGEPRSAEELCKHDALIWQGSGGLDVIITPSYYFPATSESGFAINWMWWYANPIMDFIAEEPPPYPAKEQMKLYDQLKSTADITLQNQLMKEILEISAEQFYTIGVVLPGKSYGITKSTMKNVPAVMPQSWAYPTPAPTNPCQYYLSGE